MSKLYDNSITTTSGFTLNGSTPIDDRLVVETYADLANITPYEGLIVYVASEEKHYTYRTPWKTLTDNTTDSGSTGGVSDEDIAPIWTAIEEVQEAISDLNDNKQDKITEENKLNVSLIDGLATVATSGSYNDLTNKPAVIIEGDPRLADERKPVQHNHSAWEIICDDERQFVSAGEKATWKNKQDKITEENKLNVSVIDGLAAVATSGKYSDLTDTPIAATKDNDGLMSATDKTNLDFLVDSFTNEEAGTTLDTIKEVLKAFEDMPEGADIASALAGKQDLITEDNPLEATKISGLSETKAIQDLWNECGQTNYDVSQLTEHVEDLYAEVADRIAAVETDYVKTADIKEYLVQDKVSASFDSTVVKANSLSELLLALYNGFTDGTYVVPQNKTITYSVYGYNEFTGNLIEGAGKYIDFSINGLFSNVNIKGYDNAEIKYVDLLTKSGPKFLFADNDSTYNVNVSISDVSFLSDTPKSTSWEHAYFKFHVGYDGNLFVDNCSFSNNGLMLQYGLTNSVKNCKFTSTVSSKYALWIGVNGNGAGYRDTLKNVFVEGCSFTGYRAVKLLTDTKTTSTLELPHRESQSVMFKDCIFQDITAKPALLVDCVLKYANDYTTDSNGVAKRDKYLKESSFGTGESKLTLVNNVFEHCTDGTIVVDDNFAENGYIYYTIDGTVNKVYNRTDENGTLQNVVEIEKSTAMQAAAASFEDQDVAIWSETDSKFIGVSKGALFGGGGKNKKAAASYFENYEDHDLRKIVAKEIIIEADTLQDLLKELYDRLVIDGQADSLANRTITYRIYGSNEFTGHIIEGIAKKVDFAINGVFETVEVLGYDNAELKFVSEDLIGPGFLFARQKEESDQQQYNTNVSIYNVSFVRDTLDSSSWEHNYLKFFVGYNGTLLLDHCAFLDNELLLQYGVDVSVKNCKFKSGPDKYSLWIGANAYGSKYLDTLQDVLIDNCIFTGCRGIKVLTDVKTTSLVSDAYIYEDDTQTRERQSIVIQNCTFKDLTEKPGVVIDCLLSKSSFATGESTINIIDSKFINCVKGEVSTTNNKNINYHLDTSMTKAEVVALHDRQFYHYQIGALDADRTFNFYEKLVPAKLYAVTLRLETLELGLTDYSGFMMYGGQKITTECSIGEDMVFRIYKSENGDGVDIFEAQRCEIRSKGNIYRCTGMLIISTLGY